MRSTSTQTTWLMAATLLIIAAVVCFAVTGATAIGLLLVAIGAMFAIFAFTVSKDSA